MTRILKPGIRAVTSSPQATAFSFALLIAIVLIPAQAFAQAPTIVRMSPSGGPRGTSTAIQIEGKNLRDAVPLSSGAGWRVVSKQSGTGGERITLEATIDPGAAIGPRELRLATRQGVSNGVGFWIDTRPNRIVVPMKEGEAPHELDASGNVVMDGFISEQAARDRFSFSSQSGRTWVFQCAAIRIRSRLDPILEVRDENGTLMALGQSTWESDPVLVFLAPKTGKFTLTVRDSEYKGGPNFYYRLTAGCIPYAISSLPLGGAPGKEISLALFGPNLPQTAAKAKIDPNAQVGELWVDANLHSGGTTILPILVDSPAAAAIADGVETTIRSVPAIVDGIFRTHSQARIKLTIERPSRLVLDLFGRRLGSRIDGRLRVLDRAGKEVAANDDAVGRDARLEFLPPAAGDYTIEVSNVEEKIGPDCYWRLRVKPVEPSFRIEIKPDRVQVPAGTTASLPVEVVRLGGFSGPVEIRAAGLPPGVTSTPVTITPKKTIGSLTFTAAEDTPNGPVKLSSLKIIGRGDDGGREFRAEVKGWEQYEHRSIEQSLVTEPNYVRPRYVWEMVPIVVTENRPLFTLVTEPVEVNLKAGERREVRIKIARRDAAVSGPAKLSYTNLLDGVSAVTALSLTDQNEALVTFAAATDAPVDTSHVVITGTIGGSTATAPPIKVSVVR